MVWHPRYAGCAPFVPNETWKASGEGSGEEERIQGEILIPEPPGPHHLKGWIDCVRHGGETVAAIEAGYNRSIAVLMAEEWLVTGATVRFDPEEKRIEPA